MLAEDPMLSNGEVKYNECSADPGTRFPWATLLSLCSGPICSQAPARRALCRQQQPATLLGTLGHGF